MRIKNSYLLRLVFLTLMLMIIKPSRSEIIHGFVADKDTHECLSDVLLIVEHQMEVNGRIGQGQICIYTDSVGHYKFQSGSAGTIRAQLIGYNPRNTVYMAFSFTSKDSLQVDTIFLEPSKIMLKAVEVRARAKRFTIKGDTIVFHPEAFHLEQGARLEELIAQLPGVEVKEDELTWNGKPIRVMMNGESLFGSSTTIGKLPLEAVESIKAYNKASEFNERTGKDDGSEDMVLDVRIKKSFLDKWYGDIQTQYQPHKHFAADAIANRFSETDPVMITAVANNLKQINRRSINKMSLSIGNGFGIEQYGAAGYQHRWQRQAEGQILKSNWFVNAGIAHDDEWQTRFQDTENFFQGEQPNYITSSNYYRTHTLNPSAEANMNWAINKKNTVRINVKAEQVRKKGGNDNKQAQFEGNPYTMYTNPISVAFGSDSISSLILRSRNRSHRDNSQNTLDLQADWTHYIQKGSIALYARLNYSDGEEQALTERRINYAASSSAPVAIHQSSHTPSTKLTSTFQAQARLWVSDQILLNIAERLRLYRTNTSCDFIVDNIKDLSNSYDEHYRQADDDIIINTSIKLGYIQLMPQVMWTTRAENEDYKRGHVDTTAIRRSMFFTPQLKAVYKITKASSLEANYSLKTSRPSLIQTIDYRDDSDPLYIRVGNVGLKDSHNNSLSLNYSLVKPKRQETLGLTGNVQVVDRAVQNVLTYAPRTGVYTSRPVNVRGERQGSIRSAYDRGIGNEFRLKNSLELKAGKLYGFLTTIEGEDAGINRQVYYMPTEDISLSYDHEWIQCSIFATIQTIIQRYSNPALRNQKLWNNKTGTSLSINKDHFEVETTLTENFRRGYVASGMNRNFLIWNAKVGYSFLKDKAKISLSANDILNSFDNFRSQQSTYQNTYSWSKVMHHYIRLGFTYHFDAKEKK